ncbi:Zn(2)-C6 fungal-type domain-containing protein [Mycena venus]|uniref:Zn(2)-C6 fungal-type domain-containing protein n=1 Tax=Mycena venus TaxID=2733690 RepID=A0A8H7D9Z9_9AGAR|nr:Zn(2)-C6 fungal-type domain-containing protein [Mycena venus]
MEEGERRRRRSWGDGRESKQSTDWAAVATRGNLREIQQPIRSSYATNKIYSQSDTNLYLLTLHKPNLTYINLACLLPPLPPTMFSLRSRDDPQDPYMHRSSLTHLPDESHRMYAHSHGIPRSNQYNGSPSADDLAGHYGQRRYASGSPATRFQDHLDYSIPQGLPAMSAGMSRIDTQFTRRDAPLSSNQPLSASSVDLADSEAWSPTQPAKPRKPRREKPRIELAPDQPPTTQGKPRARVYVACLQCRTRKIRCDGAKPVCHNCGKRASGSTECNYDPLPKRRGPDKTPGARQRVARKANESGGRTRRRPSSDAQDYIPGNIGNQMQPFSFPSPSSSEQSPEEYVVSPHEARIDPPFLGAGVLEHAIPGPPILVPFDNSLNLLLASPLEAPVSHAFISDYEDSDDEHRRKNNSTLMTIIGQPTLDFSRKTWWDSLLSLYLSPTSKRLESFPSSQRSLATQSILSDLRFLFRCSSYWFSFLHIPTFFNNLYDPAKRELFQPSLILAALALGIFWQSSEIGMGQRGRERALKFREEAQSALEASLNAGWVDETLAQAAWILALFEISANPKHTSERSSSAMITLDSIIRSLSLTLVDLNEPSTSTFPPGKVPAVTDAPMHMGYGPQSHNYPYSSALPVSTDRGCSCNSLTLKEQSPEALEHTPLWAQTPAWNPTWTDAEIRKESIRRLCWSSIILAAGHSSYSSANHAHTINLFIADPSNHALLFSGEAMVHSPSVIHPPSPKDTIWALYDRACLLWHACIKMRNDTSVPVTDKGQFAIKAWLEADAIEEALNRHTCGIERAFIFYGRENLFDTRICITYEFRRFVPLVSANVNGLFHRHKAEEWLSHQAIVAQQFMSGLHTVTGNSSNNLSRRPNFVFWLMGQVSRGLTLWQCDNSMTIALDVCKSLLAPIDYLTALWPCPEQRYRTHICIDPPFLTSQTSPTECTLTRTAFPGATAITARPPRTTLLDTTVSAGTCQGAPATRFQDHLDYSIPQGLPAMSAGMSRIDTQFTRRDAPLSSNQSLSASSVDLADSEAWSPTQPAKSRKTRREKPRIELAPDQPPTTQGKPRARVYVACLQCRTRKIRCDGAKPVCHNCGKRASGSTECNYDPLPKRRGPDKTPGARQRAARKANESGGRTRRRTSSDAQDYIPDNSRNQMQSFSFPSPSSSEQSPEENVVLPHEARVDPSFLTTCACHGLVHCSSSPGAGVLEHAIPGPHISGPFDNTLNVLLASPLEAPVSHAFISDYEDSDDEPRRKNNSTLMTIIGQPTLDFSRKTWWDSLLSLYLSPTSKRLDSLSSSQRSLATQSISSDLRFLFRCSSYWFSLFHIPTFFNNLYDPAKRDLIQPSLILAALALGIFWQSSEIGMGQRGRERALKFREEAQSALEASLNAGWVDDTLAQAAWLLAMFEICANPNHTSERSSSAMITLDSIIRSLSLTLVDCNEPSTSIFSPGKVPAVTDAPMHMGYGPQSHNYPYSSALPVSTDRGCSCNSLTLREQWPEALEHTPLWAQTPAWNPTWTDAEIRKESIRRLCWSSIVLAAGHSSYSSANRAHTVNLFIADPSNYALLFSGEAMVHSPSVIHPPSPKDTIWALYDRAFLLWHACIKMRNDTSAPVTDKGQFAIKTWLEADAIEEALNRHTCGIERAFIFLGREYIFNTRMCITYEFQRFVPLVSANVNGLFHRHKAEEWLSHQATVAQQFMNGLHTVTGNSSNNLSRRPFFVFWFMGQVSRGLTLWQCDNSMTIALDVCKSLLGPIDYLTALWPCPEQRYRYNSLRERLHEACKFAGISLPPPLNLTLPSSTPDEFV